MFNQGGGIISTPFFLAENGCARIVVKNRVVGRGCLVIAAEERRIKNSSSTELPKPYESTGEPILYMPKFLLMETIILRF
jgi:hypothetical protein